MRSEDFWTWFEDFAAPRLNKWPGMYRADTFRKMFEYLDTFDRPVNIVETGCIEHATDISWAGNGCSTILFGKYIETHEGSTAHSVDIVEDKVRRAEKLCPQVQFYLGDSVEVLKRLAKTLNVPVDLLFLDATHLDWRNETPAAVHHFNELMAIFPLLNEKTLVAVDDSISVIDDYPMTKIAGKGALVAQYALEVGAVFEFCQYQIGFTKITGRYPRIVGETQAPEAPPIDDVICEARSYVESGRVEAADRLYRLILTTTPPPWTGKVRIARGEAYANYARNSHKIRNYGKAIDWYRYAIEVDPLAAEYRCELARSLVALGAMQSAKRECTIASEIEPDNPNVWATFGGIESDMRNEEGAKYAYDKQIETAKKVTPLDPYVLSDAYLNRCVIAVDTKDYDYARELCRAIIEMKVREGDAWHALAIIEYRLSNHEKAIELFDKALELGCRNEPLTRWNRSLPLQSIGRWLEAFEEHAWGEHEQTVTAIYVPQRRFRKPLWHGEKNCTVHVHTEAGHGDNILMLRYLPLFKELGCTVRYESDVNLLSLAQRSFPDVEMMPRAKDYPGALGIKDFDYHIPIGDLPHRFKTDIDNVPWSGPYLKPDPMLVKAYGKKLGPNPLKVQRIGLCWSSGIRTDMNIWMEKYGRMKSMRFKDLEPLLEIGCSDERLATLPEFVSLQVGDGRDELNDAYVTDILPEKPTWDDTAALIANLDLVITVDTGVAHLAAAMGKETWVVMQQDGASYHFLCERPGASWNERNPWYPTVRVFRQTQKHDWASAIAKVVGELNGLFGRATRKVASGS